MIHLNELPNGHIYSPSDVRSFTAPPPLGAEDQKNIVIISDTHFGSGVALAQETILDDGQKVLPSPLQAKLWAHWLDFWSWVYTTLDGAPFTLVHVGDVVDGAHHKTTALISANPSVQHRMAVEGLRGHIDNAEAYYQIRGTEAHVGISASNEDLVAESLGAVKTPDGNASWWELWMKAGRELIHFSHHVGHTSSSAYESSAIRRQMVTAYEDSGQHQHRPPTIIIRGHTHRFIKVEDQFMTGIKMPAWQAKTPFTYKIDPGRAPMFGGIIIRTRPYERAQILDRIYSVRQTESVRI